MKQIVIFLIFVGALQLANTFAFDQDSEAHSVEKYSPFYRNYNTYDFSTECTQSGLMCANCTSVVNCIETEEGHFVPIGVKTCDTEEKEFCLRGDCSNAPNPRCALNITFACHGTGVFPDPLDCRVYHVCVEKAYNLDEDADEVTHIGVQCDEGYGYNPATTYCDQDLANGACPSQAIIDKCSKAGDIGPIAGTSIFYVCTENEDGHVLPQLYMCPHGTQFHGGGCTDNYPGVSSSTTKSDFY